MSALIFPLLPGQRFTKRKTPTYDTLKQRAISGKESRQAARAYPLYEWELEYNFLSDGFSQAPARTNYITDSQDNNWFASQGGTGILAIIVGNYSGAPDGSLTANRVIFNKGSGSTSGDYSLVQFNTAAHSSNATYTLSIWARTNDGSTVVLQWSGPNIGGQITVTPNWQRFSTTSVVNGGGNPILGVFGGQSPANSNYADVSLWGAQFEPGSFATSYIPTNGSAVRVSDLKTIAGFVSQMLGSYDTFLYQDPDFNTVQLQQFATGNGSQTLFNLTATYKPGVDIVEYGSPLPVLGPAGTPEWVQNTNGAPQIFTARYGVPERLSTGSRTNLILESQGFSNATYWSASQVTVTGNVVAAPDGTTTGCLVAENTANAQHYVSQAVGLTAGDVYSLSVYFQANGRTQIAMQVYNASDFWEAILDLTTMSVANSNASGAAVFISGSVQQSATNGWYRATIVGQCGLTASHTITLGPAASGQYTYTGSGSSIGIYLWGAQLETGTYATAYIPTSTTSATNGGSDYSLTSLTTAGSVNTFQQVSVAPAPANNAPLLWSGSFYYRCRFSEDKIDLQNDMSQLWSLSKIAFEQVIL